MVGRDRESWEGEARVAGAYTVALAVATDAGKHDPELARKAGAYLEEQQTLARLQIKHFDEGHGFERGWECSLVYRWIEVNVCRKSTEPRTTST